MSGAGPSRNDVGAATAPAATEIDAPSSGPAPAARSPPSGPIVATASTPAPGATSVAPTVNANFGGFGVFSFSDRLTSPPDAPPPNTRRWSPVPPSGTPPDAPPASAVVRPSGATTAASVGAAADFFPGLSEAVTSAPSGAAKTTATRPSGSTVTASLIDLGLLHCTDSV